MRVVITGAKGQLGGQFCWELGGSAIPIDLPEFNITDRHRVLRELPVIQPRAIINCAAYTLVDKAEQEPDLCRAVNSEAVAYLAEAAQEINCPLVQISTDYVFGGDLTRRRPYVETDPIAPQGVYAQSKADGERRAAAWTKHYIVRSCGLYGISPRNNNFVEAMLRLGAERGRVKVVNDQSITPTYVPHLVKSIVFLLESDAFGTYHVVSRGAITWYEFAIEIFRQAGMDVTVEPISSAEWGAPAARPAYSVLDTTKYEVLGGPAMPPWQEGLAEYLRERTNRTLSRVAAETAGDIVATAVAAVD